MIHMYDMHGRKGPFPALALQSPRVAEALMWMYYKTNMPLTLSMLVLVIDDNLHNGSRGLLGIHKSSPVTSGPRKAGKISSLSAWWRVIVRAVVRMSL